MIKWSTEFYTEEDQVDLCWVYITLSDGTELALDKSAIWEDGIILNTSTSVDSVFTVGGAVTGKATVLINNIGGYYNWYNFRDAKASIYFGSTHKDGTVEKVKVGTYIVDEYAYTGSLITLSMLDYMSKFDKQYDSTKIIWPTYLKDIVQQACDECGVVNAMESFTNDSFGVLKSPGTEALTYHDIISYAAQIACSYAYVNPDGELKFGWYNEAYTKGSGADGGYFDKTSETSYQTGDKLDGGTFSPWNTGDVFEAGAPYGRDDGGHGLVYLHSQESIATDDVLITGVKVEASEETTDESGEAKTVTGSYLQGSEGYVITITGNPLIGVIDCQTVAKGLSALIGMKFRPLSVTALGDPSAQAGDCAIVGWDDESYFCFLSNVTYTLGGSLAVRCDAQPSRQATKYRYSEVEKTRAQVLEQVKREASTREAALQALDEKLSKSAGLYTTIESTDSGNIYYLHDRKDLSDSSIVWKMSSQAWGVSTDGGKTWNGGMTVDGDTITRILSATGINFDWAKGGTITLGGKDNANGKLKILDANGTQIGQWDKDGISINAGTISVNNGKFLVDSNGKATAMELAAYGSFICYENN